MRKFRVFTFGIGILFIEAIILSILVLIFCGFLSGSDKYDGLSIYFLTLMFTMYKVLLEQWLFFLVVLFRVRKKKIQLMDLYVGKITSCAFMFSVLVLLALDSSGRGLGTFAAYAILFVPSVLLSCLMLRSMWVSSLGWMQGID